jgi:hypothetical protein
MRKSGWRERLRNGVRMGVIVGGILLAKGCCCMDFNFESDDSSGCGVSDYGDGGDHGWGGGYSGSGGTVGDASRPDADAQVDGPPIDAGSCEQDAGPGPTGWTPYPWSCGCVLFTPDSPDATLLPSPIDWEPCAASLPGSIVCERMTRQTELGPFELGAGVAASVDVTTGATLLQLVRAFVDVPVNHAVVAEADGVVRTSLLLPEDATCRIEAQALSEGHSLFRMIGGLTTGNTLGSEQGFVAGKVEDGAPSDSGRWPLTTSQADRWSISRIWIVRLGDAVTVTSWGAATNHWESPTLENKTWINAVPVEGELLLEVDLGPERQLWTWNAKAGLRALRGATGLTSAALLGTDGVHMAWAEREIVPAPDGGKQAAALMRGWFTVDAAELSTQAERVRRQTGALGGAAYRVGCGMAARTIPLSSSARSDLVLTRLDDGVFWVLDASADGAPLLSWERVVGVTCEDIYVEVATEEGLELMRIRLDSLGTGEPPT